MGFGFFNGLPTKDMTEEEWLSYPPELTKPALTQGLYKVIKDDDEKEVKDA
jgi:hypothetical protein